VYARIHVYHPRWEQLAQRSRLSIVLRLTEGGWVPQPAGFSLYLEELSTWNNYGAQLPHVPHGFIGFGQLRLAQGLTRSEL